MSIDRDQLQNLIEAGGTYSSMSRRLGKSVSVVHAACKRFGLSTKHRAPAPDRDPALYSDPADPIIADWVNGATLKTLASRYGRSPKAVEGHLRRRRINKDTGVGQLDDAAQLSALLRQHGAAELAGLLGVQVGLVTRSIRRWGLSTCGRKLDTAVLDCYKSGESAISIALRYGYKSDAPVRRFLRRSGVQPRRDGEHQLKHSDRNWLYHRLRDEVYLRDAYEHRKLTAEQLADELNTTQRAVLAALRRAGIVRRDRAEYDTVRKPSSIHLTLVARKLDELEIPHQTSWVYRGQYNCKPRCFELDEYLPQHRVFVEVQGEHWHGLGVRHWKYRRVRQKMWADLVKYLCVTRDYPDHRYVCLSEADVRTGNWMRRLFPRPTVDVTLPEGLTVGQLDRESAVRFCAAHHYLGSTPPGRYYGLWGGDRALLAAAVVSHPGRQTTTAPGAVSCGELSRLASVAGPNHMSYFLSRVLRQERRLGNYDTIVAFADPTPCRKGQHSGSVYKAANFDYVGTTSWSYSYVNSDCVVVHKKTIYNRARRAGVTEREYASANDWHKVPEWPKLKYCYRIRGGLR